LQGKSIYLPCDNPYQSQFFTYFVRQFNRLGLKQLIATCYDTAFSQLSLFEDYDDSGALISKPKAAYKVVINEVKAGQTIQELVKSRVNTLTLLNGNGDFASAECVALMKQADVVVTNPPFSLFRVLLHLLRALEKDYVLLGPSQGITYAEAFQMFQLGELYLGFTPFSSSLKFEVPRGSPYDMVREGKFYKAVPIAWVTSFKLDIRPPRLSLKAVFDPKLYLTLDGNEAILNVDALAEIPKDYFGKLAVPITFLKFWNREDFRILGQIEKACVGGQEKFTRLLIQRIKK
jgi:hypothetical protein